MARVRIVETGVFRSFGVCLVLLICSACSASDRTLGPPTPASTASLEISTPTHTVLTGTPASTRASSPSPATEADVYAFLLRSEIGGESLVVEVPTTQRYVELDGDLAAFSYLDDLLEQMEDQVDPALLDAFVEANQKPAEPDLSKLDRPYTFITGVDILSAFGSEETPEGWERFHELFPGSNALVNVSRVGFSGDKSEALVYLGVKCGFECSSRTLYHLVWQGGQWEIRDQFPAP